MLIHHQPRLSGFVLGFVLAFVCTTSLGAQGPPPGTPPGRPLTDAAAAESLAVLRQLQARVLDHSRDAAAWHRLGVVAWSLMYRGRIGPPMKGVDWTLLGRQADTALRLATILDPGNDRFLLTKAQFFLGTGPMTMRVQSYPMINSVLKSSRQSKDPAFRAEAMIEAGRIYWRRYDDFANRRTWNSEWEARSIGAFAEIANGSRPGISPGEDAAVARKGEWVRALNYGSTPLPFELAGAADYYQAEKLFREAYATVPRDERAFRELAMVLAERKRWPELEALASERISRMPADGHARMAFALAVQRRGNHLAAEAAFDTALARLDAPERRHVTSLARVMIPDDTTAYQALTNEDRESRDRTYWFLNDPLWSRRGSDARTEFLARATFADIRWTVEELGVRGIDSDRGEMHVRFGPPDVEAQIAPGPGSGDLGAGTTDIKGATSVVTAWAYSAGWLVVFRGLPTYATARIPSEDGRNVDALVHTIPASWANASDVAVQAMRSQVARFRGGQDSVDVFIAVEPPVAEIREAAGTNTDIRADSWLFSLGTMSSFHDSTALRSAAAHSWTYRVPPGVYGFRIETTADGATLAGRATDTIPARADPSTGFATRGFGISDPLLTRSAVEHGPVRNWRDLNIVPTAGTIPVGAEVSIVWENYDLADSAGAARYAVAITVQRQFKATINRIRARIVGAYAAFAGIDNTEDRVIMRFSREQPYAKKVVDHLEIALEDTPAGNYTLTLEITDRVTGRSAERSVPFTIRE